MSRILTYSARTLKAIIVQSMHKLLFEGTDEKQNLNQMIIISFRFVIGSQNTRTSISSHQLETRRPPKVPSPPLQSGEHIPPQQRDTRSSTTPTHKYTIVSSGGSRTVLRGGGALNVYRRRSTVGFVCRYGIPPREKGGLWASPGKRLRYTVGEF